jgi:DnaJ homolog subfamily A member 2
MKSLYDVLGVPKDASADAIRAAYRKLALKHHPDKGGDPEKFKEISKANEVLSDEGRRKMYDMTGSTDEDGSVGSGGPFGAGGPGGGMPFPFPFDLGAMFGGMFGGGGMRGGGGGGAGGTKQRRGKAPPKIHETPISLRDFYHGKTIKMQFERKKFCDGCKGEGAAEWETCGPCRGTGQVQRIFMMGPGMQTIMHGACDVCKGAGRSVKRACDVCEGARLVAQHRNVDVVIEPGMRPGETIVFARECSDQLEYEEAGDLHIVLIQGQEEGETFVRLGAGGSDDLGTEVSIGLCDALTGCTMIREGHPGHPEGLRVELPSGVQNGEVVRIAGEGMPVPRSNRRGDLHVRVRVVMTESEKSVLASHDARAKLRELFGGGGIAA